MKKGAATDRKDAVAAATEAPDVSPLPPILPLQRDLREAVLQAAGEPGESITVGINGGWRPKPLRRGAGIS